ncbi:hypothetical protein AT6N2_C1753 [Agrobacterium tumefaciens]|nr:hypothetical protein AT6N2_C1753 [Agrobacterium tumefaciens]
MCTTPARSIIRSRVTLATIDAAAMERERESPLMTALDSQVMPGGRSRPSASTRAGGISRPSTARRMASRLARRIFIVSIRPGPEEATETIELSMIWTNRLSRFCFVSFLESSIPLGILSGSRMTAAATTGPASGPRPASSVPATGQRPFFFASSSNEKSGPVSAISKRAGESGVAVRFMRRNSHTHPISCKPPEAGDDRRGEPGSRGVAHRALKVVMTSILQWGGGGKRSHARRRIRGLCPAGQGNQPGMSSRATGEKVDAHLLEFRL